MVCVGASTVLRGEGWSAGRGPEVIMGVRSSSSGALEWREVRPGMGLTRRGAATSTTLCALMGTASGGSEVRPVIMR